MTQRLRIAFCLPGLHRVVRGAEVALESIAARLATAHAYDVTLFGSGQPRPGDPYRFVHAGCLPRERFEHWPGLPVLRTDGHYEELTFVPGFLRRYRPRDFDAVVTCSYPFMTWCAQALRSGKRSPLHLFVTQNGDWPLYRKNSEYRLFDCDALVCTNPDYYDAHGAKWPSALIPNGVDCSVFAPGPSERERLGLPLEGPLVVMVSALIPSKRVLEGVRAVSQIAGASLVVAGDGPLRDEVERLGRERMGERFRRLRVARADMPALYRSATAFLHMSIDEPSANAYMEALATGMPIVTHDRRVTRWTLGSHALLVDTTDETALLRVLERALNEPWDTAASVAEAQSRFDWGVIAGQYDALIRKSLTGTS